VTIGRSLSKSSYLSHLPAVARQSFEAVPVIPEPGITRVSEYVYGAMQVVRAKFAKRAYIAALENCSKRLRAVYACLMARGFALRVAWPISAVARRLLTQMSHLNKGSHSIIIRHSMICSFYGKFASPGPDSTAATAAPFGQQERRLRNQALQSLAG